MQLKTPDAPATPRQLWALFCATKKDHRGLGLTMQQACDMLQAANEAKSSGKPAALKERSFGRGSFQDEKFAEIFAQANLAADAAGQKWLSAALAAGPKYAVMEGGREIDRMLDVCGFGWCILRDKRHAFHKWLTKNHGQRYTGYSIPIYSDLKRRQEMGLMEAMAEAAAEVYNQNGIPCRVETRID